MSTEQKFGEWVQELRERGIESKRLSQDDLAELMGVSQATVSAVELGSRPPSESFARRLSEVFGLSRDYALYRAGYVHSPRDAEKYNDETAGDVEEFRRLIRAIEDPKERRYKLAAIWAILATPHDDQAAGDRGAHPGKAPRRAASSQ